MKLVDRTGPNTVGLNYMWLPTWIGMNVMLIKEIEAAVSPVIVGRELTDHVLDEASAAVVRVLQDKYPSLSGLNDFLDGLKFVREAPQEGHGKGRPAAHPPGS